ncbi:hypothetical protein V1520DRAFT_337236 [Lipomyces starkeyi]|uniref:NFACT RNA-binding domain-containing protein n=1 Tax=Lipomyces starkeyi NRRL Y-11557 TaxID=675824 RepID=A0A1E3QG42_LIPST|nr:hypothetical protein LIPSTDRAFT_582 [Lipomyces starkeyi NRRL Y-11557]
MASARPISAPGNPAKYFYTPSTKLSPTTRADISTALLDLLARLDVHREQSTPATEISEPSGEVDNVDHQADGKKTNNPPSEISNKAKKHQVRKDKKQQQLQTQQQRQEHQQQSLVSSSDPAVFAKPAPRTQFWFEKYLWFVSSDGYLVLSGRYSQQSALLLTRHLSEHDVVVSAQSSSSSLVVVKNHLKVAVVPPSTLSQAATLALSTSVAWDNNGLVEAWWCRAGAVAVDTNVEEALTGASGDAADLDFRFEVTVIDKMKIPIGAPNLVMGFGILFLVDEESTGRQGRLRVADESAVASYKPAETGDEIEDGGPDQNEQVANDASDDEVEDDEEPNTLPESSNSDASDNSDQESASGESDENSTPSMVSSILSTPRSGSPAPSSLPRGKRSKLKKISTKYADQDDEDRALRMKILGSTKSEQRQLLEQDRLARRAAREQELLDQKRKEEEAALQNRVRRKEATETQRVPVRADVLLANDAEEIEEIVPYDRLVARPSREDNLLAAVPICAPWPALHKVKYKVKLLPGVGKRGKTLRKCQQYFVGGMSSLIDKNSRDVERCWPKEVFLIGALTDAEITLPVGVAKFRAAIPNATSGGQSANKSGGVQGGGASGIKNAKTTAQQLQTQSHGKSKSSKKKSAKK